ncbi:glycine---tRNA ligase [Synchytrium endobioticum]|uniref:glycine--tRNA ligase n=1 Tax=Synchytrium endobioticum TaxID=286115 RepID=A0A507DCN6_9FUNG|nr:glycine---tRNA ligase [Synchytrium endobioticum]
MTVPADELSAGFISFLANNDISVDEYSVKLPRYLRKRKHVDDAELEQDLGTKVERVPWLGDFIRIDSSVKVVHSTAYKNGAVIGMDAGSGIAARALQVGPDDHVLDLCCAPGGKLLYFADIMGSSGRGTLTGVDISNERALVAKNLLRKNFNRFRLFVSDGTTFNVPAPTRPLWILRKDPQMSDVLYDRVLVDAECTHDGSISHLTTSHGKASILENGFNLLRSGGILVYSTCSFAYAQNEGIIIKFLQSHQNAQLQRLPFCHELPLASLARPPPGITDCSNIDLSACIRVSPLHSQCGGIPSISENDSERSHHGIRVPSWLRRFQPIWKACVFAYPIGSTRKFPGTRSDLFSSSFPPPSPVIHSTRRRSASLISDSVTPSTKMEAFDNATLENQLTEQGSRIRALKAQGISKTDLQPELDKLKKLKDEKAHREAAKASLTSGSSKEGSNSEECPKTVSASVTNGPKLFDRAALESILFRRFFYSPSFAIYGGVAGLFDYGPPGTALMNNFLQLWRQHFVLEEDMLEIECTNLTPHDVLKTSGHVDRFADYMVTDSVTGDIQRADHVVKNALKERLEHDDQLKTNGPADKKAAKVKKPVEPLTGDVRRQYEVILEQLDNYDGDGLHKLIQEHNIISREGNTYTQPRLFNLMFETDIGPTGQFKGYLRPETAQGHFLNFKRLLEHNNDRMPFASASIGKSFRNEISPRQGLLRVREFTMAEIEHYVDPQNKKHRRFNEVREVVMTFYSAGDQMVAAGAKSMTIGEAVDKGIVNNETLGYFIARIHLFLLRIGIDPLRLRFRQHMKNEMAHYACDCWDAEIKCSYGWIECVGCADRSAHDLTAHSRKTGEKLVVRQQVDEPVICTRLALEVDKKKFGLTYRKNAKAVEGYLNSLKLDECDWNEDELKHLKAKMDANGGKATITGTDGSQYVLTHDVITIGEKIEKRFIREYIPNVIEPSFGIGRIIYCLIEHSWWTRKDDENRNVLSFKPAMAPTKALIVPLSNQDLFEPYIKKIAYGLRKAGVASRIDDSSSAIGRRYARNDELGTLFAVTVDFQTVKDQTVTLRARDSTKQIRESIPTVVGIIRDLVTEQTTWEEVRSKFPEFTQQEM